MFAPVFKTLSTPGVTTIVDDRIYSSGRAPQGVIKPYITWFVVNGSPDNHLSGPPISDDDLVQIDCYAGPGDDQEAICLAIAKQVRAALDDAGQSNRVIINHREADTGLFRIGIQTNFLYNR